MLYLYEEEHQISSLRLGLGRSGIDPYIVLGIRTVVFNPIGNRLQLSVNIVRYISIFCKFVCLLIFGVSFPF